VAREARDSLRRRDTPMIRVTRFEADGSVRCGGDELLTPQDPAHGAIWIDLEGPDPRFEPFLVECGFHPLAIEDTFTLQHQPKVEEYGDTFFVLARGLDFNLGEPRETEEIGTLKLAAFLSKRRLVTLHRAPLKSVNLVFARLDESKRAFPEGAAQILWSICDEMMDLYAPLIDQIAEEIDAVEEQVLSDPQREHLERILDLRRRFATLRRNVLPHRQVFGHLASTRSGPIDEVAALNFRDTQDNVVRLADSIEQQRDLLSNVKDTYLSVVAQRTNDIMRVLTVFSAVLLPLSLVAGIYGMNFERMPELHEPWGYPMALGVMAAITVGLLLWFRRKKWI
ncbi:MAG: magnesium/cobalt transporter CorA, partial [Myxococcota bacterium]